MDTPNKGHNRKNFSMKDILYALLFNVLVNFKLKRVDNLSIKDKIAGHKCVHYLEVPL